MWELLLRMITDAVTENRGVQVEFYNRFQYTVEVSAAVPGVQIRKVHPDSFLASTVGPQLKTTCVKIIITTVIVIIHQLAPRAHCRAIISICWFSGDSVDVSLVSSVNSSREWQCGRCLFVSQACGLGVDFNTHAHTQSFERGFRCHSATILWMIRAASLNTWDANKVKVGFVNNL